MKRFLIATTVLTVLLLGGAIAVIYPAQRADLGWRPAVRPASFAGEHSPNVVIDAAHHNASDARWWGRYWPFAKLLRSDGYRVRTGESRFDASSLAAVDVLVIANASGGAKPQFFGINLPVGGASDRAAPAFTAAEIAALRTWVEQGGSLLLIADHAPFGAANRELAAVFGVTMGAGFVEVPDGKSDPLPFSRGNRRLGSHPILDGGSGLKRIDRLETFTGQSLQGPPGATILMALPRGSEEYIDDGSGALKPVPALPAQGLAFAFGRGRIVVLGEAAMLTAQVAEGVPFGMDTTRNDNEVFALAVLHWLSGADKEHTRQDATR
ncbi:hypothetical protein [Arenimonas sp.]|uniref:hypothetical protein n=1 Tax=Arenimonas sp. TaxID=1872635 RepID=UPI0039E31A1D